MQVKRRFVWFMGRSRREILVSFQFRIAAVTHFLQCCFVLFFWVLVSVFFLSDFGCPEAQFSLLFYFPFVSAGLLKKQMKVCNCRQFQRFDPFQTETFCRSWLWVRFDNELLQIFVILGRFEAPILWVLVFIVVKKWILKKDTQIVKKRERR